MEQIHKIHAREVLDSRGNPTVCVSITLASGIIGTAIVPSGASTGSHEALELRDGDKNRYLGKGVQKAISNINTIIADAIEGMDPLRQNEIDAKMIKIDGTKNKRKLGANAILGVSMAVAHAAAKAKNTSLFQHFANLTQSGFATLLPIPLVNIINGGAHADSGLDIQEFMIVPTEAENFNQALQIVAEIFHTLKKILKKNGHVTSVGDEGGFAPHLDTNEDAVKLILEATKKAGHKDKIQIAFDVAASEFYNKEKKIYNFNKKEMTSDQMIDFFAGWVDKYPIVSIEDPLDEDDFDGWQKFTERLGDKIQIIGDDLLVTNLKRINKAIEQKSCNAVLIKLNQVGSVSETIEAIKIAKKAGWNVIISHRSGETEDTTIADLAVGLGTGQIKTGSLCRSERVCKYNRLLEIEEILAGKAVFPEKI